MEGDGVRKGRQFTGHASGAVAQSMHQPVFVEQVWEGGRGWGGQVEKCGDRGDNGGGGLTTGAVHMHNRLHTHA